MMSFLIKFNDFQTLSSRESGAQARGRLLEALQVSVDKLILDFESMPMSPSFADECIGLLVQDIGIANFKQRVSLKNVHESSKPLIKHVVGKRVTKFPDSKSTEGSRAAFCAI